MIYPHQQKAIDYITSKFQADSNVDALLISGSIAHGYNDEYSDIDFNVVVSEAMYKQKQKEQALTYWESAEDFYAGGYFDGKFINLDYLALVAQRGNEPTRFALQDSIIAFDRTGQVADYVNDIGVYSLEGLHEKSIRFLSQLEGWKWFCEEALRKGDLYLLEVAVSKLVLYAGRLVLLENRRFFPYHKWFMRAVEGCENKPSDLIPAIMRLLTNKTRDNVFYLHEIMIKHKDWADGVPFSWASNFVYDVETVWMRQEEFIENL